MVVRPQADAPSRDGLTDGTAYQGPTRRLYAVDAAPLAEVDRWLERFRGFWEQRLDAPGTELARGRRERRGRGGGADRTSTTTDTAGPGRPSEKGQRS